MIVGDFNKNVFINCPFDDDYRQMLLSLIFTIKHLGFNPRLSLEKDDAGVSRLAHIVELIEASKYGIHDLSRMMAVKKGAPARMNMPFELGIDYGCQKFKGGECGSKKTLVLDTERYRFMKALSDLSGSDIKAHEDAPIKLIKSVRDWFVTVEALKGITSHRKIWYAFNDFSSDLADKLIADGHEEEDLPDMPIPEIMVYMDDWFKAVV